MSRLDRRLADLEDAFNVVLAKNTPANRNRLRELWGRLTPEEQDERLGRIARGEVGGVGLATVERVRRLLG